MSADAATLAQLDCLRGHILTARCFEQEQLQQRGARPGAVLAARVVTLDALVEYADAITALAWPVPRTLLAEIQLYRSLTRQTLPS